MPADQAKLAMQLALQQAKLAFADNEVPIGAVIVHADQVIASSYNQTRTLCDPTAHAEVLAIRSAAKHLGNYRLSDAWLICTVEPCAMCVGSLIQARIGRLTYGIKEPKTGACGSAFDLLSDPAHGLRVDVEYGVLAEECRTLMQDFFAAKR